MNIQKKGEFSCSKRDVKMDCQMETSAALLMLRTLSP
jgi:hypothetical protein